jgi:hypothetical protein
MSVLAAIPLVSACPAGPLAQLSSDAQALAFAAGVVLMLLGIYLRWALPDYLMTAEERTKEGRWTESEARRRIAWMRYGGPAVVLVGLGLFLALFLK